MLSPNDVVVATSMQMSGATQGGGVATHNVAGMVKFPRAIFLPKVLPPDAIQMPASPLLLVTFRSIVFRPLPLTTIPLSVFLLETLSRIRLSSAKA
jgi:hypothetical protein